MVLLLLLRDDRQGCRFPISVHAPKSTPVLIASTRKWRMFSNFSVILRLVPLGLHVERKFITRPSERVDVVN